MVSEDLRQILSREFDLVCFVDLADVRQKHGSIFRLFSDVRSACFQPKQRLVFYTSHDPEQAFLDHIQRAAVRIDISNYFILIVCPWDITDKLARANNKFKGDKQTIQSSVQNLEHTKPFEASGYAQIDTLCPLPFSQISINARGSVLPCCKFTTFVGNLHKNTLPEIFFGDQLDIVRKQMLSANRPKQCGTCWQNESKGTTSLRQLAMAQHGDLLDQNWLDDPQIRNISWAPSALCNFKCRICKPDFSSKIAAEELQFSQDHNQRKILRALIKSANSPEQTTELIESFDGVDHLRDLHILGGEPFLWPQLAHLIDRLIDQDVAQHTTIRLNTNCSVFPDDRLVPIIENFRAVEILLSIDNVGERFEIERGGCWPDVLINAKKFASLQSSKVQIKLVPTINLQNVLYLDDVLALSKSLGVGIVWWYLETPVFLCIDNSTEETKRLIIEKYKTHQEPELQKIASRILISPKCDGKEFLDYTKKMDLRRSQSFCRTHREVYEAMGGRFPPEYLLH